MQHDNDELDPLDDDYDEKRIQGYGQHPRSDGKPRDFDSRRLAGWNPKATAPTDRVHVRGLWVYSKTGRHFECYAGYIHDETGEFVEPMHGDSIGWNADDYEYWCELPEQSNEEETAHSNK